jgi:hypothetical protein
MWKVRAMSKSGRRNPPKHSRFKKGVSGNPKGRPPKRRKRQRATSVSGIDISPVAISRANALSLPNASFQTSDFLDVNFAGYDVIAAIECLYYLSPSKQEAFYQKLTSDHAGKAFILSGPIIGSNEYRTYFTHAGVTDTFSRHGLSITEWRNLNANRRAGPAATLAAAICKMPFGASLVTALPERWVYQRCYVARCPDSRQITERSTDRSPQ